MDQWQDQLIHTEGKLGSRMEDSEIDWATTLFANESALRAAFAGSGGSNLMKKLLKNEGFLHSMLQPQPFAALLAATPRDDDAGLDAMLGLFAPGGDGASATPRQAQVAGRLEQWLDREEAVTAFRERPDLALALVHNPAFVEQVKVLKPQFFRELLGKGKERFRENKAMLKAIAEKEQGIVSFTSEGEFSGGAQDEGERLQQAVRRHDLPALQALLAKENVLTFINQPDAEGHTALMEAAYHGHADVARLLLEQGADPNQPGVYGRTALMETTIHGHVDVARLLLEKGADPNQPGADGRAALMVAAYRGHVNVARLLLEQGADPNQPDAGGRTALMLATYFGHVDVARLLRKAINRRPPDDGPGWVR